MNMKNPIVSIILPILKCSDSAKATIVSILEQGYTNIELIIITSQKIPEIQDKRVQVILKNLGKSEARNYGADKCKGEFVLHIDDDMILSPSIVKECIDKIDCNNCLIIPEKVKEINLLSKIRNFEKKISNDDKYVESPRFFRKNFFTELNGFEIDCDPLDEMSISAKITDWSRVGKIKSSILIIDKRNLFETGIAKFKRGQAKRIFTTKFPNYKQFNINSRIHKIFEKKSLLIENIFKTICYLSIKLWDFLFFKAGDFLSKDASSEINKKIFDHEANSYYIRFFKKTLGSRYVDFKEKQIVDKLLANIDISKKIKVLDAGCGTGRWSQYILEKFPKSEITCVDFAPEMIKASKNNLKDFKSRVEFIVSDYANTNLNSNEFDLIICMRTLKYSTQQENCLIEFQRILKKSGVIVLEYPKKNIFTIVSKIINIFNKENYINRIQIKLIRDILSNFYTNKKKYQIEFTIPATIYSKINNSYVLKTVNFVSKILPNFIFGRSYFIKAQSEVAIEQTDSVDCIITTKNSERTLNDCLQSINNQSTKCDKIFVIDNNSLDRTKEIAKQNGAIYLQKGPERSAQRNYGVSKSNSKFVLVHDSDIIFTRQVVTECILSSKSRSASAIIIPEESIGIGFWANVKRFERQLYLGNDLIESPRFFNREMFLQIKGYDEQLTGPEDWDIFNKIKSKRIKFDRIKSLAYHDEGYLTITGASKKKKYYAQWFKQYKQKWPQTYAKQMNPFQRFPPIKMAILLLRHPILTTSMIIMKLKEWSAINERI